MSTALATLRPADAASCARALADAAAAGRTVRVRGAGTKDYLGEVRPTDAILTTTAMRGVVAHVPADLTVTVAAGTPFAELQRALLAAGQRLPLDPPHADAATIGGIVAANSSGFWRARYGGLRDLLIGTVTALVDGTVAHAGGRVVKNVAGYDLNKLLIGSFGTLGVIAECTFKILPLPIASAGVRARLDTAAAAFAAADAIARTPARPAALVVTGDGRGHWELLVQADGAPAAVERTCAIAADAVRANGGTSDRRDHIAEELGPLRELASASDGVLVRAALPPAAQSAFASTAERLEGSVRLVADAASGIVRTRIAGDDDAVVAGADALVAAARVCGGSARIERRAAHLRERIGAWGNVEPAGLFLMRRIKDAFDPRGTLEPGRGVVA